MRPKLDVRGLGTYLKTLKLKATLKSTLHSCSWEQGGSRMLAYIILFYYVSSICLVKGQSLCPVDYHGKSHSAPYYGGYSDEYTCVSFVPRHEVPQCSSEIYECLEKFCTSQFFGGHLMHWIYHYLNGYVPYKIPIEPESDGIAVFNGMILLDRVFSDYDESAVTRPDCEPMQYCTYVFQQGGASFFSSRVFEFLQTKEGEKQLSTVSLPVCMTFELNDANSDYTAHVDVYACKDVKFDYFACQHKKYPPCKVRKKKKCHYSPNKYGLPCDEESTETCPCPCSGEPNEWSSWSATCGTTTSVAEKKILRLP
uniref:CUB domain-containing protein n=1 Tax=Trichuris muris TaxID=70415 RepID=A0A5S6Q3P5_TRIMR